MHYTITYNNFKNFLNINTAVADITGSDISKMDLEAVYENPDPYWKNSDPKKQEILRKMAVFFQENSEGYVPLNANTSISKGFLEAVKESEFSAEIAAYLYRCYREKSEVVIKTDVLPEKLKDRAAPVVFNFEYIKNSMYTEDFNWDSSFLTSRWADAEYVAEKVKKDISNILLIEDFDAMYSVVAPIFAEYLTNSISYRTTFGSSDYLQHLGDNQKLLPLFLKGNKAEDFFLSNPNLAVKLFTYHQSHLVDNAILKKSFKKIFNDFDLIKQIQSFDFDFAADYIETKTLLNDKFIEIFKRNMMHPKEYASLVLNRFKEGIEFEDILKVLRAAPTKKLSYYNQDFFDSLNEQQFLTIYTEFPHLIEETMHKSRNYSKEFFEQLIKQKPLNTKIFKRICPANFKEHFIAELFEKSGDSKNDYYFSEYIQKNMDNKEFIIKMLDSNPKFAYDIDRELLKDIALLELVDPILADHWASGGQKLREAYKEVTAADAARILKKNILAYAFLPSIQHNAEYALAYTIANPSTDYMNLRVVPQKFFKNYDFCIKLLPHAMNDNIKLIDENLWRNTAFIKEFFKVLDKYGHSEAVIKKLPNDMRGFLDKAEITSDYAVFFDSYLDKIAMHKQLSNQTAKGRVHKL